VRGKEVLRRLTVFIKVKMGDVAGEVAEIMSRGEEGEPNQ
jgi:hypothetical protein